MIKKQPLILDGATGSNLRLMGMPAGVCTEKWVNEHPEAIQNLQKAYVDAGSMAVYAPTFMANRISLKNAGLEDEVKRLNMENVKISKEAVGDRALVAGNLSTTSQPLEPIGTMTYGTLLENYKEQISYLAEAGVDYLAAETLLSLEEAMVICDAAAEAHSGADLDVVWSFAWCGAGRYPPGGFGQAAGAGLLAWLPVREGGGSVPHRPRPAIRQPMTRLPGIMNSTWQA